MTESNSYDTGKWVCERSQSLWNNFNWKTNSENWQDIISNHAESFCELLKIMSIQARQYENSIPCGFVASDLKKRNPIETQIPDNNLRFIARMLLALPGQCTSIYLLLDDREDEKSFNRCSSTLRIPKSFTDWAQSVTCCAVFTSEKHWNDCWIRAFDQ